MDLSQLWHIVVIDKTFCGVEFCLYMTPSQDGAVFLQSHVKSEGRVNDVAQFVVIDHFYGLLH